MGEVTTTTTELEELRREAQEAKWIAFASLQVLIGRKKADAGDTT